MIMPYAYRTPLAFLYASLREVLRSAMGGGLFAFLSQSFLVKYYVTIPRAVALTCKQVFVYLLHDVLAGSYFLRTL